MEVRILPPVFSALASSWVTGCFKKSVGCMSRVLKNSETYNSLESGNNVRAKVLRETFRGEYFPLNRNFNLEVSLVCKGNY